MKTVGAKIDNDLHDKVMAKCEEVGCTPSDFLRSVLRLSFEEPDEASIPKARNIRILREGEKVEGASVGRIRSRQYADGRVDHYNDDGTLRCTTYPNGRVKIIA